ncbi:MAG TPA: hypothetical protein VIS04_03735 [Woeseiaceae bacterium]
MPATSLWVLQHRDAASNLIEEMDIARQALTCAMQKPITAD